MPSRKDGTRMGDEGKAVGCCPSPGGFAVSPYSDDSLCDKDHGIAVFRHKAGSKQLRQLRDIRRDPPRLRRRQLLPGAAASGLLVIVIILALLERI